MAQHYYVLPSNDCVMSHLTDLSSHHFTRKLVVLRCRCDNAAALFNFVQFSCTLCVFLCYFSD